MSMYLPVRGPIGAMSGMFAYGVPAQPGAVQATAAVLANTLISTPMAAASKVLITIFMRAWFGERWLWMQATIGRTASATPIENAADLPSMRSMAGARR